MMVLLARLRWSKCHYYLIVELNFLLNPSVVYGNPTMLVQLLHFYVENLLIHIISDAFNNKFLLFFYCFIAISVIVGIESTQFGCRPTTALCVCLPYCRWKIAMFYTSMCLDRHHTTLLTTLIIIHYILFSYYQISHS